ncbi:hypothetical protein BC834DRAFT_288245 [Gloeopeniophorella convolvens]|nr:hypothetical protein BC834DRAFT_288245 [Gloeopeniophorella convolvens]
MALFLLPSSGIVSVTLGVGSSPTPSLNSSSTATPPSLTRADVVTARMILRRLLPLELVDEVLHTAGYYYVRYTASLGRSLVSSVQIEDGALTLATTPPILHKRSIRAVVIRLTSFEIGPEDSPSDETDKTWFDLERHPKGSDGFGPASCRRRLCSNAREWQERSFIIKRKCPILRDLQRGDKLVVTAKSTLGSSCPAR